MTSSRSFLIDCAACPAQNTDACDDCVVTYVCNRDPGDALVVDLGDLRAIRMLADGGLVPQLRHPVATMC
jgi:hypothetical protein